MKHNYTNKVLRIILLLLPLLLFGFSPANSGLIIREKDGIRYVANAIIIKLKYTPASDAFGNVTLSSNLNEFF